MLKAAEPGGVRAAAGGILALAFATFLAITTEMLPVGLLAGMSEDLRVDEPIVGLLVTVYALMVAVLAVPLTLWTRHLPRKSLLMGTIAAYVVSNVIVALAPSFAVVAAGRAIGGVAHALFFSLSIAYGSRLVRPEHVGRTLAIVTTGASAGFVLGVPLSTSLGTAIGWRAAFGVLAAGCAVALLLVALLLPAVDVATAPDRDAPQRGARHARLAAVSLMNALVYLGQYTVYTYIAVILLASGLTPAGLGPALLALGGLGLLGIWFAGATLDSRPRSALLGLLTAIIVGLLLLGVLFPTLIGVLVAAAVWSAGFGGVASSVQAAAIRTRGATPDLIGAFVNTTSNIGIGAGAAIGGAVLAGVGLEWLPYCGAALVVAGTVIVLTARRSFPAHPGESAA